GEGLTDAAALAPDHHAPEDLDTLLGALDDLDVHVKRVAGPKFGDVVAEGLAVDKVESVHEGPCVSGVRTEEPGAHLSGVDRFVPRISATSPGRARRPQESTRSVCHSGNAATKSSCPGAPALLGQHLEVTRPQLDVVEEVGASPGGPARSRAWCSWGPRVIRRRRSPPRGCGCYPARPGGAGPPPPR